MTTPANNTLAAVIEDAFFEAGITQEGQSPNSEQIVRAMRRLTDLINVEQTQGLKLWLNVQTATPLVAGQGTYSYSPTGDVVMAKPLRCISADYVLNSGTAQESRRPLVPMSWDDYMRLSQVSQTGALNSYFVNKKQSSLDIFYWLIPDASAATGIVQALLQVQVTNFTSVTETMNFPPEWKMYLVYGLADILSVGQPSAIMERNKMYAMEYKQLLEDFDVEDASTQFAPDQRAQWGTNKFR